MQIISRSIIKNRSIIPFFVAYLFVVVLFVMITKNSNISFKFCTGEYSDFNNFLEYYKLPIQLMLVITSILGYWIAYKQYLSNKQDSSINNYYRYLEQFISIIENETDLIESNLMLKWFAPIPNNRIKNKHQSEIKYIKKNLSTIKIFNIYKLYYGKIQNFNFDLNRSTENKINEFVKYFIDNYKYKTGGAITIDTNNLNNYFIELGFESLKIKNKTSDESIHMRIKFVFLLLRAIMDFSDKNFIDAKKLFTVLDETNFTTAQ